MKPFEELCSIPAYITGKNIDTDQIIPARFLKLARGEDFGICQDSCHSYINFKLLFLLLNHSPDLT
ncbi:isopropylmalate isomerase small subunit [Oligella ureolytica]|uniref:Isopropylmalate isomerase small subunit n=1 Tax=Oligella ureolytica TaxID=90244 RepID=A0A378XE57_9BURK|nr:isopropylmalate isomerase small subunit [Oligella ureolytica]